MSADDSVFTGAVAKFYETYMVPLIFEPYAEPVVRRALVPGVSDVLEIARTGDRAYCHGTPPRDEIEARGDLDRATTVAELALIERFGTGPVDGKIQAHIVTVVNNAL
ncbi:hypothetical protein [Nocardia acidivorans]|uniref:hypothetical protein n=1 Tax=Nocardia acidivorans TaxID=404580 RepID=UPI00082EFA31|nr:hypothetical protein [Nocardia acidivorans]